MHCSDSLVKCAICCVECGNVWIYSNYGWNRHYSELLVVGRKTQVNRRFRISRLPEAHSHSWVRRTQQCIQNLYSGVGKVWWAQYITKKWRSSGPLSPDNVLVDGDWKGKLVLFYFPTVLLPPWRCVNRWKLPLVAKTILQGDSVVWRQCVAGWLWDRWSWWQGLGQGESSQSNTCNRVPWSGLNINFPTQGQLVYLPG